MKAVLLLLCLSPLALARTWRYDEYPALRDQRCNKPKDNAFICDPDSILTMEEASRLNSVLMETQRSTSCPCSDELCATHGHGYVVGVAVLEKMALDTSYDSELTNSQMILTAAYRLAGQLQTSTWQLARCEEDVVVVYSKLDGVVYIVTSRKARALLTDLKVGEIIRDSAEAFANGDEPFRGLDRVLKQLRDALKGTYRRHAYASYN